MRRSEGLVAGVFFLVFAALAECATFCGAKPSKVAFNENGRMLTCRCDTDIIESIEVE